MRTLLSSLITVSLLLASSTPSLAHGKRLRHKRHHYKAHFTGPSHFRKSN